MLAQYWVHFMNHGGLFVRVCLEKKGTGKNFVRILKWIKLGEIYNLQESLILYSLAQNKLYECTFS